MDQKTFGPFLKEARGRCGLTQMQLAERLHVSAAAVSKWERGKSLPDIAKVEELANALDHLFRVWKMNYHTTGEAAALFTIGSREDHRTAKPIMDLAEEAFSSIGLTKTQARSAYGKLSEYTYCADVYEGVVSERHTLELLSAHFTSDQGLIWVYYTQEGVDESGEVITGSFRIESLWKAARGENGQWKIYDIKEHP